jgi:hypothetical protein
MNANIAHNTITSPMETERFVVASMLFKVLIARVKSD